MLSQMYKRLLLFVVVVGPIFWLVFTTDGQRRSDAALLWLLGKDELLINPKALSPVLRRKDIEKVYRDIDWQCAPQRSAFGDALCAAPIGLYNDIPARYATLFFDAGHLNALKVEYLPRYHRQLIEQLHRQLGTPQSEQDVYRWLTGKGMVLVKQRLGKNDEPALLWLPQASAGIEN